MRKRIEQALVGAAVGFLYWSAFTMLSLVKEPWDGAYYWSVAYPGSIIICASLGAMFGRSAWITGTSVTFAQLPIMLLNTFIGSLSLFGLAFLFFLSLPASIAAWAAAKVRRPN